MKEEESLSDKEKNQVARIDNETTLNKSNHRRKLLSIGVVLSIALVVGFILLFIIESGLLGKDKDSIEPALSSLPTHVPSSIPSVTPFEDAKILDLLPIWAPKVIWLDMSRVRESNPYGQHPLDSIYGWSRWGQVILADFRALDNFESRAELEGGGWMEEPGYLQRYNSDSRHNYWGYTSSSSQGMRFLQFHRALERGTMAEECPCVVNLTVFVSDTFNPNAPFHFGTDKP